MKKNYRNWWIDFITRMANEGVHHPQIETQVKCLLFLFLQIIQLELNYVAKSWNMGQVRQSSN